MKGIDSVVLPNKRHEHTKAPVTVFHKSTESIYDVDKDGKQFKQFKKVKSNTLENPETIERKAAFVKEVQRYTEERLAAALAKLTKQMGA